MGIFSGIFRFFKKLLRAVMKFLKKFWPLILLFAIAIAVFFPVLWGVIVTQLGALGSAIWAGATSLWGWYSSLFAGLSFWEGAALALGTAFLIAPEATGEVIKDAAGVIGEATGSATSGLIDGVFSSPWIWLVGAGVGLYFLTSGDDDDKPQEVYYG